MRKFIYFGMAVLLAIGAWSYAQGQNPGQQPQKISQLPATPNAALAGSEVIPCDQPVSGVLQGAFGCTVQQIANFVGVISSGVSSYAGRTGAVVPQLSDLTTAFGAAPGTAFKANQSANTGTVADVTGAFVVGHIVTAADTAGTLQDGGAPAAGTGTVNSGTAGQITKYATTGAGVSGDPNITTPSAGTVQFGVAGTQGGTINLAGATSGVISFTESPIAGTYNFVMPTAAGTAGQPLLSGGGGTNPQTYGTLGTAAGGTGAITAAGARTNLGIGTAGPQNIGVSGANVPLLNGANAWSGGQSATPVTLTFGATVTPNFALGNVFILTLTGNVTSFANPTNLPAGQCIVVFLVQDATGGRTISGWGSQYKFPGGVKPTLTTAASSVDSVTACSQTTSFIAASFLGNFQ